jgi:phenylpyruvate tautomerase PptA (4-oxalocrotonate tautomerase family)
MPLVSVTTSAKLPPEEKVRAFLRDLSSTVARLTHKPESYVMTCLVPRSAMTFGGTSDPCCLIEVKGIGGMGGGAPKELSEALCALVQGGLGVPGSRTYVVFADIPARLWGFDGSTFG